MQKLIAAVFVAAALTMIVPSVAGATSTPSLPSGVDQAYLADSAGNPQNGTVELTGALTYNGAATITCTANVFDVDYDDAGLAAITSYAAGGCSVAGFPNCPVDVTPVNLPWGAAFGHDTSTGDDRLYINVSLNTTFTAGVPTCPAPAGTYSANGVISPRVFISGTTITVSFGAGSGSITGPLGPATLGGGNGGTVPSGSQIVF